MVVTGVPGVGKSTVVTRAMEELQKSRVKCELINYGDVMLEMVRERAGIRDRDEMRKVPIDVYREIQREAAERIAARAKGARVLVDTHCLVRKPEGYYPGLPSWVLEALRPESIVLIEATPEEVVRRRVGDVSRRRDEEMLHEVEEHQQLNRAVAVAYAAHVGAAVRIINNRQGRLKEAMREMVEVLK